MEKRFDEGFDNILIFDYDREYCLGKRLEGRMLVEDRGRNTVSLNGKWHFNPDVFCSTIRSRWFDEIRSNRYGEPLPYDADFENWEEVQVPGTWNQQRKECELYEGAGIYFRTFFWKEPLKHKRLLLKIGAANYETRIWLNKKYLGRHLGGFTPFCADITDAVQEENRLLIMVDNQRKSEQVPSMHYDWFNYGGLFRDIQLLELPEIYLQDFYIGLCRRETGKLEYRVRVRDSAGTDEKNWKAEIRIDELGICQTAVFGKEEKDEDGYIYTAEGKIFADESKIKLWSPDEPYRYLVNVSLLKSCPDFSEKPKSWIVDELSDEIGFRRIETRGRKIFLNGKEIFLRGVCVHEESPDSGRCVTGQEIEEMILQAKELGCNFLRLTHYPHTPLTAELADRMGIMLLEEIPVYWALEFGNQETFRDAANQLEELIRRDQNRASVILWSVGNENPDSDARYRFMAGLVEKARQLDASRLIGASCLMDVDRRLIHDRLMKMLDVVGINEYYGWYLKDFETLKEILGKYSEERPMIITETGAEAVSGLYSSQNEAYSETLQADIYERQFSTLLSFPFICGVTPWILYDYRSMRRMSSLQKGYNLKGLLSANRKHKKQAFWTLQKIYACIKEEKG